MFLQICLMQCVGQAFLLLVLWQMQWYCIKCSLEATSMVSS